MTKEQLAQLTIKQLKDNLSISPECFELYEDPLWPIINTNQTYSTIIWKFKVLVGGNTILDPNNAPSTVILTYCKNLKKLTCMIFFREVDSAHKAIMPDASIELEYKIPILNKSYREFNRIRKTLIRKLKEKDRLDYLKKLNSIFPAALDDQLLN